MAVYWVEEAVETGAVATVLASVLYLADIESRTEPITVQPARLNPPPLPNLDYLQSYLRPTISIKPDWCRCVVLIVERD